MQRCSLCSVLKINPALLFYHTPDFVLRGATPLFIRTFLLFLTPSLLISAISPPPRPPLRSEAESSISWSSRIHLIMAAFPHLLPLNHSLHLYFSGRLIHLYMSHYLPRRLPSLSHSSILLAFFLIVFLSARLLDSSFPTLLCYIIQSYLYLCNFSFLTARMIPVFTARLELIDILDRILPPLSHSISSTSPPSHSITTTKSSYSSSFLDLDRSFALQIGLFSPLSGLYWFHNPPKKPTVRSLCASTDILIWKCTSRKFQRCDFPLEQTERRLYRFTPPCHFELH